MAKIRGSKYFKTLVCLVLGCVVLTTAALANYASANGYTVYKEALKKLLFMKNYTADVNAQVIIDGEIMGEFNLGAEINADGEGVMHSWKSAAEYIYGNERTKSETWTVRDTQNVSSGKFINYYRYINEKTDNWNIHATDYSGLPLEGIVGEESTQVIRFVELAADLIVGDLKNNFVYNGETDGNKNYSVSLSGSQLPEIINAGISLLFSEEFSGYSDGRAWDTVYSPEARMLSSSDLSKGAYDILSKNGGGVVFINADGTYSYYESYEAYCKSPDFKFSMDDSVFLRCIDGDPKVETATCEVSVNENGELVRNILEGTASFRLLNGEYHTITIRADINLSNIGTTVVALPKIPANAEVYDYSNSSYLNNHAYTVTKGGVTIQRDQYDDNVESSRSFFNGMTAEECVLYLFNQIGEEIDLNDPDLVEKFLLRLAAGEFEWYMEELGFNLNNSVDVEKFTSMIEENIIKPLRGEPSVRVVYEGDAPLDLPVTVETPNGR